MVLKTCHLPSPALLAMLCMLVGFLTLRSVDAATLTVNNIGLGSGSISGDMGCTVSSGQNCAPATFPDNATVTLVAAGDWKSLFGEWGTPCGVSATCSLTLPAGDTILDVSFDPNYQAILGTVAHSDPQFSTLTDAYAAAGLQPYIFAHEWSFHEDLVLNNSYSVKINGGWNGSDYLSHKDTSGNPYFTTLLGTLDVQAGSSYVDSLIVNTLLVEQGALEVNSLIIQ